MPAPLITLIIHSSDAFRGKLHRALAHAADLKLIGSAAEPLSALARVQAGGVDAVCCDIESPGAMDFIRAVHSWNSGQPEENRTGVVVVAPRTPHAAQQTILALEAGAFDFVALPAGADPATAAESLARQLLVKLRSYSSKRYFAAMSAGPAAPTPRPAPRTPPPPAAPPTPASNIHAVLIAISTGGPKTLAVLMPQLCRAVSLPICIVQHMPPGFTGSLAASLNRLCRHAVREAQDGDLLTNNTTFIAQGGRHMVMTRTRAGALALQLNDDPPELACRPSANVLFRSAARVLGGGAAVLVLTGMGADGTAGLAELKAAGAYVLAQDEKSSVVWGMPGSVVNAGLADKVLPPFQMAADLANFLRAGSG